MQKVSGIYKNKNIENKYVTDYLNNMGCNNDTSGVHTFVLWNVCACVCGCMACVCLCVSVCRHTTFEYHFYFLISFLLTKSQIVSVQRLRYYCLHLTSGLANVVTARVQRKQISGKWGGGNAAGDSALHNCDPAERGKNHYGKLSAAFRWFCVTD